MKLSVGLLPKVFVGVVLGVFGAQFTHASEPLWETLKHTHMQAQSMSYEGTLSTQSGTDLFNSRVKHVFENGNEYELIEQLDGQPTKWIRHNNDIQCILPDRKMIIDEKRHMAVSFPRLITPSNQEIDLSAYYEISELPQARVANRTARVLALRSRDEFRYGYRLFLDKEHGLLLKSQLLDHHDRVLEQVGFTDVNFEVSLDQKPEMLKAGPGWHSANVETHVVGDDHLGYKLPMKNRGFVKVQSLCKSKTADQEVHQTVFTDGLATVSVFVQAAKDDLRLPGAPLIHGAVMSLSKLDNQHLVTVIGEVPQVTLESFLDVISWKQK